MLKPSARWPQPWTSTDNRDVQSSRIVVFLFLFLHVSTVEHWGDYLGVFFGPFSTSLCVSDVTDQACKITFTHMRVQQTKHNIKMVGIGGLCYLPGRGEFLNTSYSKHLLQSKGVRQVSSEYSTNIGKKFLQHEQYGKWSHCFPLFNTSWQACSSILLVPRLLFSSKHCCCPKNNRFQLSYNKDWFLAQNHRMCAPKLGATDFLLTELSSALLKVLLWNLLKSVCVNMLVVENK